MPLTRRKKWWPGEHGQHYNNSKKSGILLKGIKHENVLLPKYWMSGPMGSFLCVPLIWLPHTFVFLFFHSASSSHLPLNLFSLFCKLGVLVRHRISLFGKDSVNIRVNSLKIKYLIFKPIFLKDGKLQLCSLACCLFPCFWWHVVVYPGMLPTHFDFLNSGNICKSLFSLCSLVEKLSTPHDSVNWKNTFSSIAVVLVFYVSFSVSHVVVKEFWPSLLYNVVSIL